MTMQIVSLVQGSPEWHAHRAQHFNASDAPAMMACSPYMTRAELIKKLATGITAEVDAATQRIFDAGHQFEALARPLAEEIIGEELSPCVGTSGKYSASFDGLTFMLDDGFEHKSLNAALREAMIEGCTGAEALRAFIERIPAKPATDQEFADTEAACKALKKAEDMLEATEAGALAQISDVELLRRTVADLRSLARSTRLTKEKLVTAEKEARRTQIVTGAQTALDQHVHADAVTGRMPGGNGIPC